MQTQAVVREIRKLKRGWTSRRDEARIIDLLAACDGGQLNEVLGALDPRKLLNDLSDRRLGPDNETRLVKLLTEERLSDLSLETRARLVWGMQRGHTTHMFQHAIRNVMLASTGEDLRALRNLLNTSGDHQDLQKLVFEDIEDEGLRSEILEHIAANAVPTDEVRVLSDIDDTVFARLHDRRYPGKTRYPGVLAFFNALDRAPDGTGKPGGITFVTARPTLLAGLVERFTRRTLRGAGIDRKVVLTGSLWSLRSHRSMAARKVESIRNYRKLFPEYGFVFVGDSGQGDVRVGKSLLEEFGNDMRGVFIHDVRATPVDERTGYTASGIDFFDTYIAAAAAALERGVISAPQAMEVADVAIQEVEQMKFASPTMREDRLKEHRRDRDALAKLASR